MSEISAWLKNQTIFITGVTGFLGKVMLWKMLKEAGDGVKIYAMVRPSKDSSPQKRLDDLWSAKIFDELLAAQPHLKDRVVAVEGDIIKDGFGISNEDQEKLENEVTVVIHSAATTKFNENLKLAVEMNVLGVKRMLDLAKKCKKLVSVVHISTCYVAADKPNTHIEDAFYPTRQTPYEIIELVRDLTVDDAEKLMEGVVTPYPNTYSFTKALGEQLLLKEKADLPICCLRPSIVTASWVEPMPGWIDVMFGPAGLLLATGMGAMKVMIGELEYVTDWVPVDTVCNAIIAAAWSTGKLSKSSSDVPFDPKVYHVATSSVNPLKWKYSQFVVPSYFAMHRPKKNFGDPSYARMVSNKYVFSVLKFLLHFVPAGAVDGLRILRGKKPFMLRAAKKLDRAMGALTHFTTNQWFFSSKSMEHLANQLSETDKKVYNVSVKELDWDIYMIIFLHGIRKYLLKEDKEKEQPAPESVGWFQSILNNIRSYLVIISLGCLMYFFRQHFWLFKLRAKQLQTSIQQMVIKKISNK